MQIIIIDLIDILDIKWVIINISIKIEWYIFALSQYYHQILHIY